jgi:hypothetical protein
MVHTQKTYEESEAEKIIMTRQVCCQSSGRQQSDDVECLPLEAQSMGPSRKPGQDCQVEQVRASTVRMSVKYDPWAKI